VLPSTLLTVAGLSVIGGVAFSLRRSVSHPQIVSVISLAGQWNRLFAPVSSGNWPADAAMSGWNARSLRQR
jgi:hypothetical protein